MVSQMPRRNSWTVAWQVQDQILDQIQRLLNRASRDTFAAMDGGRRFA